MEGFILFLLLIGLIGFVAYTLITKGDGWKTRDKSDQL